MKQELSQGSWTHLRCQGRHSAQQPLWRADLGRGIKKLLKYEISCDSETISRAPSGRLELPVCPLHLTRDVWCDYANVRRFSGEIQPTLSAPSPFKSAALMFSREGLTCTSVVSGEVLEANGRILSTSETVSGLQGLKANRSYLRNDC